MPARGDAVVWSSRGEKSTLVKAIRPSSETAEDSNGSLADATPGTRSIAPIVRSTAALLRTGGERLAGGSGEHDTSGRSVGVGARGPGLDEVVGLLGLGARDAEVAGELAREAERQRRHDAERDQPGGQDGPAAAHRERAKTLEKTCHLQLLGHGRHH